MPPERETAKRKPHSGTSTTRPIHEFLANADEILAKVEEEAAKKFPKAHLDLRSKISEKGVLADQGIIAGCSGGLFDNITEAAAILKGGSTGNGYFSLSVYPTSVPTSLALTRDGQVETLLEAGAIITGISNLTLSFRSQFVLQFL